MTSTSDTYQRILDSAKELIYAKSYADVGVAAICDKAEVQKGSFYHFFASKQDLTLAVIDRYYLEFKDRVLDHAFSPSLPPIARFKKAIELLIEGQTHIYSQTGQVYGCPFGNLALEVATQDEPIRQKLEQQFYRLQMLMRTSLEEAVQLGEINNIDIDKTAAAILAFIEGALLMAKTQNDPNLLRQLLPAALTIRL